MSSISNERLAGVIAGACFFRAADSVVSISAQLLVSGIEPMPRLAIALPPLVGAVIAALISYAYLKQRRERWVPIAAALWFVLSACLSLVGVITAFHADSAVMGSFLSTHLCQLVIAVAFVALIVILAKKEKPNQAPEPMPLKRHGSS